jgi:hypothetical protein
MKGLFIPDITAEMFRNGCLESIEALMAEGEIYDIEYSRWIPCSERLPEEDKEVLISYRYKEGEGDTSNVSVDITTYGQMYFGGNKVGNHKHWRAPFEYFESNYEVIAWLPLPEPFKTESEEQGMSKLTETNSRINYMAKLGKSGVIDNNTMILADIAKSLAMIADKLYSRK